MKKIIDAMDKGIGMLEKIVLFGSITVMLIVTAIEVLDAKVLHANLMWTTEVNRIMLVWCILSGASVAAGTRSHLGVEFLVRKMPKKIAKWVAFVIFTNICLNYSHCTYIFLYAFIKFIVFLKYLCKILMGIKCNNCKYNSKNNNSY